jgi:hypothetical protein
MLNNPAPEAGVFKESVVSADDGAVFNLLQRLDGSTAAWRKAPLNRRRCYPETWPRKLFSLDLGNLTGSAAPYANK